MMRLTLLLVLYSGAILRAQPATTQISDVVYNQDATKFNGTLTVSLASGSAASGGTKILRSVSRETIRDGVVSLALVPNVNATPANTSYLFQYSNGTSETCTIPVSNSPITLSPYCVPGAPFTPTPVVPLAWLNVTGTPNGNYCATVAGGRITGLTACSNGGGGGGTWGSASGTWGGQ